MAARLRVLCFRRGASAGRAGDESEVMSVVVPIRPGMKWSVQQASGCFPAYTSKPKGIFVNNYHDYRRNPTFQYPNALMLNIELSGSADHLIAAGIVTADMLSAIPKSNRKLFRGGCSRSCTMFMMEVIRRKNDCRVDLCLYDPRNPDLAKYERMFGLGQIRPILRVVN
jgi:hypothetical protein